MVTGFALLILFGVILVAHLLSSRGWEDLLKSMERDIDKIEQEVASSRRDIAKQIETVNSLADDIHREVDAYERLLRLEQDYQMRDVLISLRDGFILNQRQILAVGVTLQTLDLIAEQLQGTTLITLRLAQAFVVRAAGISREMPITSSEVKQTQEMMAILEKDVRDKIWRLSEIKTLNTQRAADLKKEQKTLGAWLIKAGNPTDRIGQWSKKAVELAIIGNQLEQELVNKLQPAIVRVGRIVFSVHDTIKAQTEVLKAY